MDIKEIDILGESIGEHWYYKQKAKALAKFIGGISPSIVLDVGAGSGFFSKNLLITTSAKEAWCVDTSYAKESDELVVCGDIGGGGAKYAPKACIFAVKSPPQMLIWCC